MIHRFMPIAAAFACTIAGLAPAQAQPVYRCGDSYSQKPCPGGRAVNVEDPRSPAQREDARAAAQRDARTAQALEKERLKAEAAAAPRPLPAASASATRRKQVKTASKPLKPLVIKPLADAAKKPVKAPTQPAR